MRYGITLMGNRVAPRCTHAETVLMVSQRRNGFSTEKNLTMPDHSLHDLCELLLQNRVDTLICGGITRENKQFLEARHLEIIDNVACSAEEIINALKKGDLKPGYGYQIKNEIGQLKPITNNATVSNNTKSLQKNDLANQTIDCLSCLNKVCLKGESCRTKIGEIGQELVTDREMIHMLEASTDIACESERTLCRLSELIYFCLEMKYQRLGLAYCQDLSEPAEILVKVLRRFFKVFPICCKIGGLKQINPLLRTEREKDQRIHKGDISCNPWGQAKVLNHLKTDINVMVGICMGADCIFMQGSQAPVTALIVKDKSLANNPIGALYSDYYLNEAAQARAANHE